VAVPRLPDTITSCNCSLCHRIGALWAYYTLDEVDIHRDGEVLDYMWGDRSMRIYSCAHCGSTTHDVAVDDAPDARVGVNLRMAPRELVEPLPVRHFDGAETWQFID
jgi:hypothetical protein